MNNSKEVILNNIREALGNVPDDESSEDVEVPRRYRRQGDLPRSKVVDLFADRAGEYKASVRRITEDAIEPAVAVACREQDIRRLVVPAGIPAKWLPGFVETLHDDDDSPLSHRELDESDGVITTCALAVAQTGTIILDAGEGQGRRALTLVPDYHLCVVRTDQIVELFPEAIAHFERAVTDEAPPITLISGPSATSDIELSRVEGVHGPRRLDILISSA